MQWEKFIDVVVVVCLLNQFLVFVSLPQMHMKVQ
jgi:hypothetical protein